MRQLLMLGFYCEVYRREPTCRIYINDVLIDEFNIPHVPNLHTRHTWSNARLSPTYWSMEQHQIEFNPPFLKFIEFDDTDQRSMDLRVEIKNDDNNYANGFMTKYTRVQLSQCWLAPVKFWEKFDQIRDRWKFSRHNWHRCVAPAKSLAHYYTGERNFALDVLQLYAHLHFPDIIRKPLSNQDRRFYCSNYKFLPQTGQWGMTGHYWTGSTGYYHLTLIKKLGFWRHSTDRRRGWWKISYLKSAKDLYDKYKQYEDTRNINQ